jgi:hypothetical protein
MTLHIPDPPPVQNSTFPAKRFGWNTAVVSGAGGATTALTALALLDIMMVDYD